MPLFLFKRILPFFLLISTVSLHAQRALTVEELDSWKRITGQAISDDGRWVAAKVSPWEGDSEVFLYNAKGKEVARFGPADSFRFSPSSQYLLVTTTPAKALTDSLKLAKAKRDAMPMNSLVIHKVTGAGEMIDSLEKYKIAAEADWIAFRRTRKDKTLNVRNLDGTRSYTFPAVSDFAFAAKGRMLWFLTTGDTLGTQPGLYVLDPTLGTPSLVREGKETFKNIYFDRLGERLAFLWCEKKDSTDTNMELWLSEYGAQARPVVRRGEEGLPEGWVVSQNGRPEFSEDGTRLYFGTAPEPRRKDTTTLAEYRPDVHLWSWDEPVQYTVQNNNLAQDRKRSYRAVYNIPTGHTVQLATEELPNLTMAPDGNAEWALVSTTEPYSLSSMWEIRSRRDIHFVSVSTGRRRLLAEATYHNPRLSPGGKYAFGYSVTDSLWYSISLPDGKYRQLTDPATFTAWDELFDMPDYPSGYGAPGWTEEDRYLLVFDRYDIWRLDPEGIEEPVNLTVNGRREQISYRYIGTDREEKFIDTDKQQLLAGFNERTKERGFYSASLSGPGAPQKLLTGPFRVLFGAKAKNSSQIIYTQESFREFPELRYTGGDFRKPAVLTKLGRQQEGVKWGSAELVSWVSLDGERIEGLLYKPADFDPKKKYPMIVNFYERSSDELHRFRTPEPHRSTIDYNLYLSNGYIVFNPDVVYSDSGYPGQDCFNCVMPGISMLVEKGFVDEKAIGAQGHSWGGYQVAYLATRTNLFAAIESGAPVVNMFSAYGGIRWGSGMSRAFQYEHTQSRIGGNPWTAQRELYESSPLFHMDKVNTPILIMNNDRDGHVPWYQGIEYFLALKRLGKPAWMLNYTGEIHWPAKIANRNDFQKRMFQFFNHYLRGEQMPPWMKDGIPALDRDYELGY